jgi:hypothetical protein
MEKRKGKPKDKHFPIEFISPFSLEECVTRLPSKVVTQISRDAYEFELRSNINDKRNQFINVYGYLQRNDETTTLILGEATFSPLLYIFTIAVIPFIAMGFSKFVGSLVIPVLFIALIEGLLLYFPHRTKKQLSQSIFEIFKPKRKVKARSKYQHQTLLFPWLSLKFAVDLPVSSCAIQLQQVAFWPALCRMTTIDEQEYHFDISGLFDYWVGMKAIGSLTPNSQYTTQVNGKVGLSFVGYWHIIFILLLLGFLAITDPGWLPFVPIALFGVPLFTIVFGLVNVVMFRKAITKTLMSNSIDSNASIS